MPLGQIRIHASIFVSLLVSILAVPTLAASVVREQLFDAIEGNDLERVRLVISTNPRIVKDTRNVARWTPLYEVVFNGSDNAVNVMKILMEFGADPNARDSQKNTPLHVAGDRDRESMPDEVYLGIIDSLLEHRADVSARNQAGVQPLHLWMVTGADTAAVERLLAAGVDMNSRATKEGWTPLHGAIGSGRTDLVRLLLDKGARVDVKDAAGLTPLQLAKKLEELEIAELLLNQGANE